MENDTSIHAGGSVPSGTLPPELFVNRELSWLEFNRRVLLEAMDEEVPLLERLKFTAIYSSNLDEFFMVRVGSLTDKKLMELEDCGLTGETPLEQIHRILEKTADQSPLCEKAWQMLCLRLAEHRVDVLDFSRLQRVDELLAERYFHESILPMLSPQIIDRHHPFPFLKNKELYVIVQLGQKGDESGLGIVPLGHLPAYTTFATGDRKKVALTADIVCHCVQRLFTKYSVQRRNILRCTRNADLTVDENGFDEEEDFRGVMQELLKKRRRLNAVRVQLQYPPGDHLAKILCKKLEVEHAQLMVSASPLDMSFGFPLAGELAPLARGTTYPPLKSRVTLDLSGRGALKKAGEEDMLLAYPFQSMKPFVDLLYAAAEDPAVISIKMTLYRLASHSRIAAALAFAADKGKEVVCVLELRARFDEQSNIDYARMLEDAGCTVTYGLPDYKVHAKLCLITRRVHGKISYVTQVGTGNYNEKTAELYTDLCLITGNEAIGKDAADVFSALCIGETPHPATRLWVAPNGYIQNVLAEISKEVAAQSGGGSGYVAIKANSLGNPEVMQALVAASQAGVRVELFVRGICCLRPGMPGYTENVTVRSIVGRYLEHTRIFVFGAGERQRVFIGSGDLLNRNLLRRVEVFAPVLSQRVRPDVLKVLDAARADTKKAWEMLPDGSYRHVERPGAEGVDSQMLLYEHFTRVPESGEKPARWWSRFMGRP